MHPARKGCRRKAATNAQARNISDEFPRASQGTKWVLAGCWFRIGKPVSGRTTFRDTRSQHRPFCEPAAVPRVHWQGSDAGPSTDQPIQDVQRTLKRHVFHTRSCDRTGSRNGVLFGKNTGLQDCTGGQWHACGWADDPRPIPSPPSCFTPHYPFERERERAPTHPRGRERKLVRRGMPDGPASGTLPVFKSVPSSGP